MSLGYLQCGEDFEVMSLAFIGKLGFVSDRTPDHDHHRSAADFNFEK